MDEKRRYFRVPNNGEIEARYEDTSIEVIDLSANSAAITNDIQLPASGTIRLSINNTPIIVKYDILKKLEEKTILIFNDENQIDIILRILKIARSYFRVQNKGEIVARFGEHPVEIFDISAISATIKNTIKLPQAGAIKLIIGGSTLMIQYKLFRVLEDKTIINFYDKQQNEVLLELLKALK